MTKVEIYRFALKGIEASEGYEKNEELQEKANEIKAMIQEEESEVDSFAEFSAKFGILHGEELSSLIAEIG